MSDTLLDEMEARWAPRDSNVFKLVPDLFQVQITALYENIGSPAVSSNNFWTVYQQLWDAFHQVPQDPDMQKILEEQREMDPMDCSIDIPLIPGLAPLRNNRYGHNFGDVYMGGVPAEELIEQDLDTSGSEANGGVVISQGTHRVFAEFSDEEG